MPDDNKQTTIACPVTGNPECKEPSCSRGCYLMGLKNDGWSDAEILDLLEEVVDVDLVTVRTALIFAARWTNLPEQLQFRLDFYDAYVKLGGSRWPVDIDLGVETVT